MLRHQLPCSDEASDSGLTRRVEASENLLFCAADDFMMLFESSSAQSFSLNNVQRGHFQFLASTAPLDLQLEIAAAMDSPDEAPYLCMSDTRCRLCQFGLREGDSVVARIEYDRFSSEFSLRMNDTTHDKHEPFPVSDAFLAAGEYSFEPPGYEEHRSYNRIRHLLTPKLNDVLQTRLPPEILASVARLLVRECAIITAEAQSLGTNTSNISVDLSRDVYASYCVVDGVRYVNSLVNSTSGMREDKHHVLASKGDGAVRKIWIAEDHRGIRSVRLCPSDAALPGPTPIARSWWRSISAPCGFGKVNVKTDGVKLRDILVSDETAPEITGNLIGWANPEHPTNIMDLTTLRHVDEYPERFRMNSFSCNAKGTTGYTVVTDGDSVATIQSHGCADDTSFYVDIDASFPGSFFAHMPLDDGEYVTEICRRFALDAVDQPSVCLVFITNKGRNALFGTSGPPDSCRALDKILTPARDGTQIYFNVSDSVTEGLIRYLAFDGVQSPVQRPFPPSLVPNSPFFWTQSNEPWFVSSCDMEGIVELTLCRDLSLTHKPILGILVKYENGHRDCLGQFRYDKLLERVRVDRTAELYIGSRRTARSFLYVVDVLTSPPADREELFWMEISRGGTMEWWSSLRHSVVRHTSTKGQFTNMAARK
ncbi:hypothetical protein AK830_g12489 [Neonectria ditissima]|uniref:Uncharacterized protein n=1 Tax=Neonectria ditissima TaxID=78410 RepID=A0A0P7AAN6_9HYPO|nr:hypothetical protein AK830_g12489 [Neonectria ditissima]